MQWLISNICLKSDGIARKWEKWDKQEVANHPSAIKNMLCKVSGGGIIGLLLGLSSGCGNLPIAAEPPHLEAIDWSQLPPCVEDDCNCEDFRDQPTAQQVFEAWPEDPFVLDPDANGVACEALPTTVASLAPLAPPSSSTAASAHLGLGNPTHAGSDDLNNYLLTRSQYALSYNSNRGTANWVSWQVNADWLGEIPRQDNFREDAGLPLGVYRVTPADYADTEYDRGHIVPSGDRTNSVQDNAATFLMTNILPQAPDHNRGVWQELEAYSRDLVYYSDRTLVVIAGGYGEQAKLAAGRVTVPTRLWKILVVIETGQTPDEIDVNTQVIAVDIPNREGVDEDWRTYQTTVDRIELATGYDFLAALPANIQAVLEARVMDTAR